MSEELEVIFEEALRLCAPARERLERLRQQISFLQRQERRLARTLGARERAIERARRALRAAEEEDERALAETEAGLRALEVVQASPPVPDGPRPLELEEV